MPGLYTSPPPPHSAGQQNFGVMNKATYAPPTRAQPSARPGARRDHVASRHHSESASGALRESAVLWPHLPRLSPATLNNQQRGRVESRAHFQKRRGIARLAGETPSSRLVPELRYADARPPRAARLLAQARRPAAERSEQLGAELDARLRAGATTILAGNSLNNPCVHPQVQHHTKSRASQQPQQYGAEQPPVERWDEESSSVVYAYSRVHDEATQSHSSPRASAR